MFSVFTSSARRHLEPSIQSHRESTVRIHSAESHVQVSLLISLDLSAHLTELVVLSLKHCLSLASRIPFYLGFPPVSLATPPQSPLLFFLISQPPNVGVPQSSGLCFSSLSRCLDDLIQFQGVNHQLHAGESQTVISNLELSFIYSQLPI